jgi:CubicO group peptidase (beta-lactamase class C family)
MSRWMLAALALLPALSRAAAGMAGAADLVINLDRAVPRLMRDYNVPAVAVSIIENRKVTALRTYGVADLATRRQVTTDTLFNVGSISKTFTSWGVMRLVAEGRAQLDTPVDRYLTRWHLPPSQFDRNGVTLRRLLSHTAGLSAPGYIGTTSMDGKPTLEASLSGDDNGAGPVRIVQPPGTGWSYSGGGYSVVQLVVEERTGRPFGSYYEEHIFAAMGLTHTHLVVGRDLLERSARPHDLLGREIPDRVFVEQAAAGVWTSIGDLGRLALLTLHSGTLPEGGGFLPSNLVAAMLAPQVAQMPADPLADTPRLLGMSQAAAYSGHGQSYGLGYHIFQLQDGLTVVGHTGATLGWRAGLFVALRTGQAIAIVTNSDGGRAVRDAIICYWHRQLSARYRNDECPRPASPLLQMAYLRGATAAVLARAQALRRQAAGTDFSQTTLVDVAYSIQDEAIDEAQRQVRHDDAISLLRSNLRLYPGSAATRAALAQEGFIQ